MPDTYDMLRNLGLHYYNEAVLVTPTGSLVLLTAAAFPVKGKLGKGHQNVLMFPNPLASDKNYMRLV